MQVIRHDIDHVRLLDRGLEVKVPEIPVRRGYSESDAVVSHCSVDSRAELLQHGGEVDPVVVGATAVCSAGVLPVKVDAVKGILLHEVHQVADEGLPVVRVPAYFTKQRLRVRAVVAEGPPTDGDDGLEPAVFGLDGCEVCQELLVDAVHGDDLEVPRSDVGKGEVQVGQSIYGDVIDCSRETEGWLLVIQVLSKFWIGDTEVRTAHPNARLVGVPSLIVSNDTVLAVAV